MAHKAVRIQDDEDDFVLKWTIFHTSYYFFAYEALRILASAFNRKL